MGRLARKEKEAGSNRKKEISIQLEIMEKKNDTRLKIGGR